ncbi:hypothetical protein GbCGDNIH4_7211 [Granulibacter bethesdensis CGDNIH4]|nr:hypothetical protein GbCGDNIH4_7211 [Granulibacter bethesdensis CGDNIH4]
MTISDWLYEFAQSQASWMIRNVHDQINIAFAWCRYRQAALAFSADIGNFMGRLRRVSGV